MPTPPAERETNGYVHETSMPFPVRMAGRGCNKFVFICPFSAREPDLFVGALCPKDARIVPARAPTSREDTSTGPSRRRQEGKVVRTGDTARSGDRIGQRIRGRLGWRLGGRSRREQPLDGMNAGLPVSSNGNSRIGVVA